MENDKKNCKKHGYTEFKYKENKKGGWYSCKKCLREQWRKSSAKLRKKVGQKEYHLEYNNSYNKIKKSLSVFLTMILIASKIKPE